MNCAYLLLLIPSALAVPSESVNWVCPVYSPTSVRSCIGRCPFVDGTKTFVNGEISLWSGGSISKVYSPIFDSSTQHRAVIGSIYQMTKDEALAVLDVAKQAWDQGQGEWPQMSLWERILAVENLVIGLRKSRENIANILMWEICKTQADAYKEFDRTMEFVESSIAMAKVQLEEGSWRNVSGIQAKVRRGPLGVTLLLAPFNYPLNEMYAMLIPCLLMGNIVVMKLPNIGGLAHILTSQAFAKAFPKGTVNFVTGSGKTTCGPMMAEGGIDALGFIGSANTADTLISAHPTPHRLKVFSQLEGKNLGIVMKDADVEVAVKQCVLGALSYNRQRCTAIKLIMVHRSKVDEFLIRLNEEVSALKGGLPWDEGVSITPLPEISKPAYLEELLIDAIQHGAKVINENGGAQYGALFTPAIVYPVNSTMRVFHEEQFGPVIPVGVFDDISEVILAAKNSWNGQQAAIFTEGSDLDDSVKLMNALSTILGRININMQCSRSPDVLPFSGRRSSAMGTMSVSEALKSFSIETVIAYPQSSQTSAKAVDLIDRRAKFLLSDDS